MSTLASEMPGSVSRWSPAPGESSAPWRALRRGDGAMLGVPRATAPRRGERGLRGRPEELGTDPGGEKIAGPQVDGADQDPADRDRGAQAPVGGPDPPESEERFPSPSVRLVIPSMDFIVLVDRVVFMDPVDRGSTVYAIYRV